ncbi:MAG: ATP-binding cassette domain-containing protein, partial [Lacticaseibacillus paracasei]|nr:ATP-binding cassette domain-containing protein [Lacticaseibacillus paracasei]
QEIQQLNPKNTVIDEIWDDHPMMPEKDVRSVLAAFLFLADDIQKPVSALSGGQKARLELTKLALKHDNFLVLDEPTNHLDINSKEVLEQALKDFSGTVLFVSHDRYFINELATNVVAIAPTGSTTYLGNWDYYQEKLTETQAEAAAAAAAQPTAKTETAGATSYQQSKEDARAERKLQREVDDLEQQLQDLSQQEAKIQKAMTAPDVLSDYIKMQTLQTELETVQKQTAKVEDAWEEKGIQLEDMHADNN